MDDEIVGEHMLIDEERGVADLPVDVIQDAFYADCSPDDVTLARTLLQPEPIGPYTESITTTAD